MATPQEIFDVYDKLFATEGWKDIVADFTQRKTDMALRLLDPKTDEKELYRTQGVVHVYDYIINLENTMEAAKQHVADE